MTKCMEEIKRVINYRVSQVGKDGDRVLALCLSSRRNMCVHAKVMDEGHGDRDTVDSLCRDKTSSWVRNKHSKVKEKEQMKARSLRMETELTGQEQHDASSSSSSSSADDDHDSSDPELCDFFENYLELGSAADIPQGVYSLVSKGIHK